MAETALADDRRNAPHEELLGDRTGSSEAAGSLFNSAGLYGFVD